jgi:plastocyanin
MTAHPLRTAGIALTLALVFAGCGSDGGSPTPPSETPGSVAATITIGANGVVSPKDVTVAPGSRVTFVNNHNVAHQMYSDPHPQHGSCPPLDSIGNLNPGESRTSGNLNTPGVCSYHDHLNDSNTNLKGTVRVQ